MRGFRWWEPRDDNRRAALLLLIAASAICALLALGYAAAVIVTIVYGQIGGNGEPSDRLGDLPWGWVLGLSIGIFLLVTGLFAIIGSSMAARTALRRVPVEDPAEVPEGHGARTSQVRRTLEAAALGVGEPVPRLWMISDPAPNALVVRSRNSGHVCLTSGALSLPSDEIDALCVHSVTRLASAEVALASAGATVLIAADRVVRWTWLLASFAFFTAFVGVAPAVIGAVVGAIAALILFSTPCLAFGARMAVRLLDNAGALADLETVRVTNEPSGLANLLLRILEDDQRVQTSWQVAHLWFERDGAWQASAASLAPEPGGIAYRFARSARRPLLARAAIAIDLANGDRRLRNRLATLEQATIAEPER